MWFDDAREVPRLVHISPEQREIRAEALGHVSEVGTFREGEGDTLEGGDAKTSAEGSTTPLQDAPGEALPF